MTQQFIANMDGSLSGAAGLSQYDLPIGPPEIHRIRMFLHGDVGVGKTSFAASFPKTAILEFERKVIDPPTLGEGTQAFYAKSPSEWQNIVKTLEQMKLSGDNTFDTIAIDTANTMLSIWRAHLTKVYYDAKKFKNIKVPPDIAAFGEKGAGWSALNRFFIETFDRLYSAGYGWIALAHTKNSGDEGSNDIVSSLNAGTSTYLYSQADCSGFLESAMQNVELPDGGFGMERKFTLSFLAPNDKLPARSPLRKLPDELSIPVGGSGHDTFKDAYETAKTETE